MKKTLSGLILLMICTCALAQSFPEKYAETITKEELKTQLTILAGPEMEGRETATEGQRKAAAYIADQFKQAGLLPAPGTNDFQQEYPLFFDTLIKAELIVKRKKFQFGKDFLATVQANETRNIKESHFVFAGYGISDSLYDDYRGKDVKGKILIMFSGEPKGEKGYMVSGTSRPTKWTFPGNTAKATLAKQRGAAAIIVINPNLTGFTPESVGAASKTNLYYPKPTGTTSETVNLLTVSHAAAVQLLGKDQFARLLAKAKAFEPLNQVDFALKKKLKFDFTEEKIPRFSSNVAGYIEGTDKKDEYVIMTGHYDHLGKKGEVIFYGADDDGSGTVSVIEMAKAFAKAKAEGNGPRRSVVFMTVSGEEKGLLGSQFYSENPLFPLNKTTVDLNTDMVGRIDPSRKYGDSTNYVYVIGEDRLSSDLIKITDEVNAKYSNLEIDRKFNANDPNRYYFRSDHYNFAKKGVPIIFYFNGTHADYHKGSDTVDKINFDLLTKRVRLVFHTAWVMANRDEMLKRDIPLVAPKS